MGKFKYTKIVKSLCPLVYYDIVRELPCERCLNQTLGKFSPIYGPHLCLLSWLHLLSLVNFQLIWRADIFVDTFVSSCIGFILNSFDHVMMMHLKLPSMITKYFISLFPQPILVIGLNCVV